MEKKKPSSHDTNDPKYNFALMYINGFSFGLYTETPNTVCTQHTENTFFMFVAWYFINLTNLNLTRNQENLLTILTKVLAPTKQHEDMSSGSMPL